MFSEMPPKTHDVDTAKSEVLAYICQEMSCDMSKAVRLFTSMRHPKCRVLVFDKIERQWKGCSFRPSDAETSELSILREHGAPDFKPILSKIKSLAPDVVYMVSYVMDASLFMKQIKELRMDAKLFAGGAAGFAIPEFIDNAKDAAE